jgi:hypothetical protein
METPNNIEETLWNYIDGSVNESEQEFVEELLRTNSEWRQKYAELMEMHQVMQDDIDLEQPSMRFTQNVMEEISRLYIAPATRNYINKNVIRGIGLFFITTIVGLVGYIFGQIDWAQPESDVLNNVQQKTLNWGNVFNSTYVNVFIMVNIVLGLMLLDMYLRRRRETAMKKFSN